MVCKASVLDWLGGLDLAVGVVVCKPSMLNWLGGPCLPSIYMHCTISSSGWSSYARHLWSVGRDPSGIVWYLVVGIVVCKASVLNWLKGSIYLLYMCIVLDLAVGVGIQGIYAQLTGGSICLLYICIVLDLAVGVAVCKVSLLNWLGV